MQPQRRGADKAQVQRAKSAAEQTWRHLWAEGKPLRKYVPSFHRQFGIMPAADCKSREKQPLPYWWSDIKNEETFWGKASYFSFCHLEFVPGSLIFKKPFCCRFSTKENFHFFHNVRTRETFILIPNKMILINANREATARLTAVFKLKFLKN